MPPWGQKVFNKSSKFNSERQKLYNLTNSCQDDMCTSNCLYVLS